MHACELLLAVLILAASRPAAAATDFPFALNTSGEAVADILQPEFDWTRLQVCHRTMSPAWKDMVV